MSKKIRLALLISGRGTTMEAIVKACQSGELPNITPVLVVASRENARGIQKAKDLGVDVEIINPRNFESKEEFGERIILECEKRGVNMVGQYGWMVMTPLNVIKKYQGMIVNQHPGPLDTGRPDFGGKGMFGLRVHEARLLFVKKVNREFWTEVTAHRVTDKYDDGEILKREVVPILENDTAETLQERCLPVEHRVQIEALRDFVYDEVFPFIRESSLVKDSEVKILDECKKQAILKYP